MPFISVKSYPKDEETIKRVADKINRIFLEEWGCPPQAISIAWEQVKPEDWHCVVENEIEPNKDKMQVLNGESLK